MTAAQFTIDLMKTSIFWIDQEGFIQNINKSSCRGLGYTRLELLGMSINKLDPKLTSSIWQKYWLIIKEEQQTEFETQLFSKSGQPLSVKMEAFFVDIPEEPYIILRAKDWSISSRYQQLFEITEQVAKIGAWDWNLETNEVLNTREIYNIYDLNPDDMLNPDLEFQSFKGTDLEELEQAFENTKTKKTSFELILNFTSTKGVQKLVYIAAIPKIFNNKVVKIQGILQDVSNKTKTELSNFTIQQSEELIFWLDKEGNYIFVNQKVCQIYGYLETEFLTMNIHDVSKDLRSGQWSALWEMVSVDKRLVFDAKHHTKNGRVLIVDIIANYINFKGKEFICAFATDITEKKDLQRKNQLTIQTINQAQDIILWTKIDGTLLFFNNAVRTQLGYTEKEFRALKSSDLILGYDKTSKSNYHKILKNQYTYSGECILQKKDGSQLHAELKSSIMVFDGETINCSIFRDISDRKKRELELQQLLEENQRLKESLEAENTYLTQELSLNHNFDDIISISPNYATVLSKVEEVANTEATVLIFGETETGKELLARAVHNLSNRSNQSLVKINCAALPENLIESELFGHEKGAFTGAITRKIGRFELANQATLFLDEIGELPIALQPKLLRVLQEGEFSRLGSNKTLKTDVRIIAATNRDLPQMVAEGTFREDLFYRLNVFPIENIPLRERKEDIPVLVKYFLHKFNDRIGRKVNKISSRSLAKLQSYDYPGNIRELENIIERAVITSKTETLDLSQWNAPEKERNKIFSK